MGGVVVVEVDAPVRAQIGEVTRDHLADGLPFRGAGGDLAAAVAGRVGRVAHPVDDVGERDRCAVRASVGGERGELQDALRRSIAVAVMGESAAATWKPRAGQSTGRSSTPASLRFLSRLSSPRTIYDPEPVRTGSSGFESKACPGTL